MVFELKNIDDFFSTIDTTQVIKNKNQWFYNLPCSFDIETSSFYETADGVVYLNDDYKKSNAKNGVKKSIMYIWQFAINNNVIYGRTWQEFLMFIDKLSDFMSLECRFLVVYVHNLSYEFQFICKWFKWGDVFADSERKPIKAAMLDHNIIFKCSYRLSGYSLAVLADNLHNHKIEKLVGDLDYNLLRNSKTPLTEKELSYCFNDVLIVTAYIAEQIEEWGNIENIPLTQTGKVRRFVRARCFENKKYHFLIQKLTIDKAEYLMLKNAFAGGFTHCNAMYTENVCHNVTSYDFTSSYPTVLIAEKYPMSRGMKIDVETIEQLDNLVKNYSVLMDLTFNKIESSFLWENIISVSKCRNIKNSLINNGRLVKADTITITITDLDYLNIKDFYKWESVKIGLVYIYKRDYLPKEIIETILSLYKAKTELKGVDGKEVEYLHSKELLNSIYGMCVTSIVHDKITFTNEWNTIASSIDSELDNYNKDKNRFLFYHWGVWCTAYARNNLYTGIKECKSDYIYSDTDSIKIFNADKHKEYFEKYNKWIVEKLKFCLNHYNLPLDDMKPKTIKGIEKPLGVWDFDGQYDEFKSLGAKRYIVNHNGNISITVCGLSKKSGKEYITSMQNPFDYFNSGMYVDSGHTGKMTHTYIDNEIEGILIDYLGNSAYYHELSYIHLEKTDYLLSLTKMYLDYYKGLQKLYK